ncbi:protein transport protein Sec31A isoform X2 [Megalops cyprinoides]|uniref:protein transport protein Sec31A isoform X2 n=1 Tax=Megalops cyprinoides TaxID=118141 RepID=UPI0018646FC2|nr:protein transport protein Sec31A isoform X2 [Megalops cyprinoides]
MRLKKILRTAHQAWSPAALHPTYLAAGTSAQQLDASFSTSAALEIFEMDFADPSQEMKLRGALSTTNRFHSLIWVNFGMGTDGSAGRLIGGSENGALTVYSPEEILASGDAAIIGQSEKHSGPVRALDFNPFQSNLLASGANDSEIYIWDLNNFSNPMTPGAKSQLCEPLEDISVVAWNRQVQHILASANPSGKAVVWDLRKNEPIIKISDHSNRMHCSGMLWHPEVATQLVLASEDDRLPVIQMWDLRFATSPLKVLESHTRGILSISWSQADPELLLSSAKDNRILCWNPTNGEVIYELPTTNQWCFNVQWCPRNPALLSAASFDGRISVYSVMGGSLDAQQQSSADKISASFDTMDPFGTGQVLPPLQVPQPTAKPTVVPPLKKPPKWVRRPVGASFAFGGKLITFENLKPPQQQGPQAVPRQVFVSQVVTETEFLQRSGELQAALQAGSFSSYCQAKITNAPSDSEQDIWRFLKVNFEDDARVKFLRLLGFSKDELEKKISSSLGKDICANGHGVDANDLAEKMQLLSAQLDESGAAADALSTPSDFFSNLPNDKPSFQIPVSADTDGLISQALLVGNFEGAVDLCLNDGRFAEAILLAISGGEELLKKTQQRYLDKQKSSISKLISSVVTQNWRDIVQSCDLDNWKEALAALLTYTRPEEFAELCDALGARLEHEGTEKHCLQACLCYICSGNIEKLVECWALKKDCSSPLALEELVEKVMVLRKSIERLRNSEVAAQSPVLADKLTHYAGLLASQGSLAAAMSYLPAGSNQAAIMMLRDRLFHAQGEAAEGQAPPCPYNKVSIGGATNTPAPAPAQPAAQKPQKPGQYQPMVPTQMGDAGQPPMPTVFTPRALPTESVPPFSYSGMPPTSHMATHSLSRTGPRPAYPQHPATAPGFPPVQPFNPAAVSASFPPRPAMPGSNLSGPPLPSASTPGSLPIMPSPGLPQPSFMPPASLPSGPVPPSSQAGAPVPMYPGGSHSQGPAPPLASGPYHPMAPGYPPGGPGAPAAKPFSTPAVPPPPTGYFPWLESRCEDEGSQEGWNDPPAVRGGPRKKKLPDNYTPPAPITAPVMGLPMEPAHPHEGMQAPPGAPQEPSVQLLQQLPAERVEQRDIPADHLVLKTTFDGLVQRCQLAAGDPQTKRKLDDASKRLEHLYDKLRDQTLSPSILAGLHEVSRCIESRNYQHALAVHTQIVSSSNFSEISAFMPILKVVMTIANKLSI